MPTVPVHPPRSPSRRFRTAAPLGRRSGQEVFNGERIGGVLAGASTVRCGPKTYSLQTGALCLSRECLTITKALRGVGEVVGLGSAVQLRRTERRQRGIRGIRISVVERNSLIGFSKEINGGPNPLLGCDGNEPRVVGREEPILICLCADHDFRIEENRVN